jgi:hypothetical protein
MSEVLASALCVVQDRDMRCWLTLEADPKNYFPTLTVIEKCCVLWCHSRSAGTAGVPHPPGRLGRAQKSQLDSCWESGAIMGLHFVPREYRRPVGVV